MVNATSILVQSPSSLSESELYKFMSMVRLGGEVGNAVLEDNVRKAARLVAAYEGGRLVAVAALKVPQDSYRRTIRSRSGVDVDAKNFPFELGYLFVIPRS
jgi:hypothetical protein